MTRRRFGGKRRRVIRRGGVPIKYGLLGQIRPIPLELAQRVGAAVAALGFQGANVTLISLYLLSISDRTAGSTPPGSASACTSSRMSFCTSRHLRQ